MHAERSSSRSGVGSLACLFSALIEAEPQGRARGLAVRFLSGSIGSGWLSIMCGLRDFPTVRYQKLSGAEAENCLREVDVPEFQGFGI